MKIPAEVSRGFGFHPVSDLQSAMTAGAISAEGNSVRVHAQHHSSGSHSLLRNTEGYSYYGISLHMEMFYAVIKSIAPSSGRFSSSYHGVNQSLALIAINLTRTCCF